MFQTTNGLTLTEVEKRELRNVIDADGLIDAKDWLWKKATDSGLTNVSLIDCAVITLNETRSKQ